MNIFAQYALTSMIYLFVIVFSAIYCKYGKKDKWKERLKNDVAPIALILLIAFNVVGLVLWLGELLC